jgi:hypothetical protein
VDGEGRELALVIHTTAFLPPEVQHYQPNARVGDVPLRWVSDIGTYTHAQILKLVVFYKDDFGINEGDLINVRRNKLRNWLTGEELSR